MGIITLIKIWFSLFWRTNLYIFTIQLYGLIILSGVILYCLGNGTIPELRSCVFAVFNLSDGQTLERLSMTRLLITEGTGILFYIFVLLMALRRLPAIPFKGFRISPDLIGQAFIWLGPIAQGLYLVAYAIISYIVGHENPFVQAGLVLIAALGFIPRAFRA